ncbi:MAG TPA: DEAD/DEAH box helicase [Acidimicrobiales bacterium]
MALDLFSPAVRAWFESSFRAPSAAQAQGWPAIAQGDHTLILAPTGSGKTLAAFLWSIDRLATHPPAGGAGRRERRGTSVVYVSPLRALAVDVEKNLRAPLVGIRAAAERLGEPFREPTVGLRTGDTPAEVRRQLVRRPPDILITTPESLYLMVTSQARETLRDVEAVIVDEIHSLVPTKRGAHLALTLERLAALNERPPQRIGLSATQRPLDVVARFLGGYEPGDGGTGRRPRPVTIVDAGVRKELDVEVVVPVDDMADLGQPIAALDDGSGRGAGAAAIDPTESGPPRRSIWPAIHPRLLELVESHRSTLIFVNARRLAERLATRLNELRHERADRGGEAEGTSPPEGVPELVKAHHGSLSRERRVQIEDELKSGRLRGLVATSSLELGIDMGAVDLVVQVESPRAVSRGLSGSGGPATGSTCPAGARSSPSTATTCSRPRSWSSACATGRSRPPATPATRSMCCASRSWPWSPSTTGRSTTWPSWSGGRPRSPSCPTRCSTPCSTCCRAATRPRSSPSCGPAWCGTGSRASCGPGPGRSGWPSPTPARSPTGACSACSCPTAPGWASSTRRWSTRAARARRSCSAPPPGGWPRSPTTG